MPLLLLPALGFGELFWEPVRERLDADFDVTVWDAAAEVGRDGAADPAVVVATLLARLDALGIDRVDICGAAWGGALALDFASRHPERVGRLVALSTAPDTDATFTELVTRIALISTVFDAYLPHKPVMGLREHAALVRDAGLGAEADAVLRAAFTPEFAGSRASTITMLRAHFMTNDSVVYERLCTALTEIGLVEHLPGIRADTLILAAADDWSVPPGTSRVAALALPTATRVVVRGAAAFLFHPDPDGVADLLIAHLTKED